MEMPWSFLSCSVQSLAAYRVSLPFSLMYKERPGERIQAEALAYPISKLPDPSAGESSEIAADDDLLHRRCRYGGQRCFSHIASLAPGFDIATVSRPLKFRRLLSMLVL